MKTVRVDPVEKEAVLHALHTLTFPGDEQPVWTQDDAMTWIVYDNDEPVAFLLAIPTDDGSLYFSRVGVMPAARGRGLQRSLMRTLVKAARKAGYQTLVSTTYVNPASANNFVREQWMTYNPANPWGVSDTIYWRKDL